MDKKIKNRIKNIAADILVSPLTAIAASKEMAKQINDSEGGRKIRENLKKKSHEVSETVKSVSESNKGETVKNSVKDVAEKIGGVFTEGIGKVNDFLHDVENKTAADRNTDNIEEAGKNFQAEEQADAAGESPETKETGEKDSSVSGEWDDASAYEAKENSENSNCSE